MYPEEICTPMRLDLTEAGFEEMKTAEAVSSVLDKKEGELLMKTANVLEMTSAHVKGVLSELDKKNNN